MARKWNHPNFRKGKMVNSMVSRRNSIDDACARNTRVHGVMKVLPPTKIRWNGRSRVLNWDTSSVLQEREGVEARKALMRQVDELNERPREGRVELVLTDSYFNMKGDGFEHVNIIELAKQAMIECDVEPMIKPIRGGTDGARLSFMGLPSISFTGYSCGIHEFITIQGMEQAVKVIVELSQRTAIHYQK